MTRRVTEHKARSVSYKVSQDITSGRCIEIMGIRFASPEMTLKRKKNMKLYNVVSAFIGDVDNNILLIKQLKPHRADEKFDQGDEDDFYWMIPGGKMDPGETREESLVREIREETGLTALAPYELVSRCQYTTLSGDSRADVYTYKISNWQGDIHVDDPCRRVIEAKFFPLADAIAKIDLIEWRCMREPLLTYLHNDHTTQEWHYQSQADGTYKPVTKEDYACLIATAVANA